MNKELLNKENSSFTVSGTNMIDKKRAELGAAAQITFSVTIAYGCGTCFCNTNTL